MENSINSSLTGIRAYEIMINNTANNVANVNTEGYRPLSTTLQDSSTGGVSATTARSTQADRVDLSKEAVDRVTADAGFNANLTVLKKTLDTQKTVIDMFV